MQDAFSAKLQVAVLLNFLKGEKRQVCSAKLEINHIVISHNCHIR